MADKQAVIEYLWRMRDNEQSTVDIMDSLLDPSSEMPRKPKLDKEFAECRQRALERLERIDRKLANIQEQTP